VICEELNRLGYTTAAGTPWRFSKQIRRLLAGHPR
jgi:hypothetical protein